MNPFCRGCLFAVPMAVALWVGIFWLVGCSALAARDVKSEVAAGLAAVKADVKADVKAEVHAEATVLDKKVTTTLGDHGRMIQRNGTSDTTLIAIIIGNGVLILAGLTILLHFAGRLKESLCRYRNPPIGSP